MSPDTFVLAVASASLGLSLIAAVVALRACAKADRIRASTYRAARRNAARKERLIFKPAHGWLRREVRA